MRRNSWQCTIVNIKEYIHKNRDLKLEKSALKVTIIKTKNIYKLQANKESEYNHLSSGAI